MPPIRRKRESGLLGTDTEDSEDITWELHEKNHAV